MSDSLDGLDFPITCDGGGCVNTAEWVAYPGTHRKELHDLKALVPHLVCNECYNKLLNASGLVCMECRNNNREEDSNISVGDYYSNFVRLEEVGKSG